MPVRHLTLALSAALTLGAAAAEAPSAIEANSPGVAKTAVKPPIVALATAPVAYRDTPREYRLDGVVEAVNRSTVSAQTQGQIQEILYDVDDYVQKDAVVARIKDTEHRARVAQAAADMKSAAAQLEQTRDEHARISGLFAKKNVSDSAMDKASADLSSAESALDAATARLEQAREQLAYTQVRAPYSGIVTHRHAEVGEIVSPGQPIMSGISLDELRVIVDVPQSVIPSIRAASEPDAGARVYLPDGESLKAKAVTVFPYADLGSNTFKVRVDLPPETHTLFPGMYVKIGFALGERSDLWVPKQAVVRRSEVTGVYVVTEGDHVHFRQVRLGRELDDTFLVLAGLSEGELVALDPIAAGVVLKTQAPVRHVARADDGHG